jgi:hypothetical protein
MLVMVLTIKSIIMEKITLSSHSNFMRKGIQPKLSRLTYSLNGTLLSLVFLFFSLGTFAQSVNLDQVRNGSAASPESPGNWANGNLGPTQAHLAEGFSVPYRVILSDMPAGESVTLTIAYDAKENGKHAIDYLTHYDRSEPHFLAFGHSSREIIDPTIGVSGINAGSTADNRFDIPTPPGSSTPLAGQPTASHLAVSGESYEDVNGFTVGGAEMSIWNGEIFDISYPNQANLSLASSEQQVDITFTVSGSSGQASRNVVIAWGGHIASRVDWGRNQWSTQLSRWNRRITLPYAFNRLEFR